MFYYRILPSGFGYVFDHDALLGIVGQHTEALQGMALSAFLLGLCSGVCLLLAVILAFSLGSIGSGGRGFLADLQQADGKWLFSAFWGGVIFNLSNILLVAAIDLAGMAVAFPVGVGLALVLGMITTYLSTKVGNVPLLSVGVGAIMVAIIFYALAYKRLSEGGKRRR